MIASTLILSDGRHLLLGSLYTPLEDRFGRPFAALVPAFDMEEREKVETMAATLVDRGCVEFCCVGPEAERLHDSLDGIIEDKGALGVVTTWHGNTSDACEYFLFAAGGKAPTLLALVASHPELAALLESEARGY